jgi:hypothetical protein
MASRADSQSRGHATLVSNGARSTIPFNLFDRLVDERLGDRLESDATFGVAYALRRRVHGEYVQRLSGHQIPGVGPVRLQQLADK